MVGFPKSFFDPVKKRRLQYGWVRGPGLVGEDDATLPGTGLSLKSNHQSLLREVTYDPRLAMLYFAPVEELKLLRTAVLASLPTKHQPPPTIASGGGQLPLGGNRTFGGAANQSEIRVRFAMPSAAVTLGVRVMCNSSATCLEFGIQYVPAPAGAKAWGVNITRSGGCQHYTPVGPAARCEVLPLLATDMTLEMTLYVDQTVAEVFFMGGRLALTQHVPASLLRPRSAAGPGNAHQSAELYSLGGAEVTVANATMYRMGEIWDVATHGRPHAKPSKTDDGRARSSSIAAARLRPMPSNWSYECCSRFPVAWFGNNVSGYENERQRESFGKYSLIMFGWQAMQAPTNYSHTLRAQVEQARRVKQRWPGKPTAIYVPGDGAQPLYDAMLPLFEKFEHYKGFFYLDAAGMPLKKQWKCAINTTHSGAANGVRGPGCELLHWNFYNSSAKEYYLEVVLKRVADLDPANEAFDGIFVDAAMGFMRSSSCPKGAANCPANVTKAETDAIGTEILRRTVENLGKWGKYPLFNAHYVDMSYAGDTPHDEGEIVAAIGNGGMMRYYDGDAPLSIALIDNVLRERESRIPTVFHAKSKKQKTVDAIAVFLVFQQNYSYFMESNGCASRSSAPCPERLSLTFFLPAAGTTTRTSSGTPRTTWTTGSRSAIRCGR